MSVLETTPSLASILRRSTSLWEAMLGSGGWSRTRAEAAERPERGPRGDVLRFGKTYGRTQMFPKCVCH
jgi:hypothetical protein